MVPGAIRWALRVSEVMPSSSRALLGSYFASLSLSVLIYKPEVMTVDYRVGVKVEG